MLCVVLGVMSYAVLGDVSIGVSVAVSIAVSVSV
jgi:hypothetical protein